MNGSWHLGKLAGIDLRIHWTFLLLPVWIYFSSLAAGSGAIAATVAVFFVLAIFACVVLHELGHALTARQFGIPTRDITLLPIGGVARLQRMPRSPWQELAIALAGPAVNVVIAALIFGGMFLFGIAALLPADWAGFVVKLAWVNVALVLFNLLPAFPMDGGRVLRAGLALALPYAQATKVAATVGQFVAAGLGFLGLMTGNLMLVFIAGFIFLAARGETMMVERESLLGDGAGDVVMTPGPSTLAHPGSRPLPVVSAQWNARSALGWLSDDSINEFLVSSHGAIIGIVRKVDLLDAVAAGRGGWAIEQLLAMRYIPFRGLNGGT